MNSIYNFISKNRWVIPLFIFILFYFIYVVLLSIHEFKVNNEVSFLTLPAFFLFIIMLSIYFVKDDKIILLLFSSFSMWFFIELFLYQVSPYKSYNETNGSYYYTPTSSIETHFREHSQTPNSRTTYSQIEFDTDYTINSYGFRGEEPNIENLKIMLVGDSFIEGWGVDNDSTINKVMERKIGCDNCVVNAGVIASDLIASYIRMSVLLDTLSPKLLILNINNSDLTDVLYRHLEIDDKVSPTFEFFYGISFVFRHIAHIFFDLDSALIKKRFKSEYHQKVNEIVFDCLLNYRKMLKEKNIEFLVTLQPYRDNLKQPLRKTPLFEIHKFLEKNEFIFYNSHQDLQAYGDFESLHWPLDRHFNNKGAKVFGELIYEALKEEYNLDSLIKN